MHDGDARGIGHFAAALVTAGALVASCWAAPARAAEVADFYQGRNESLVIGYSVGGGYDLYARLLARHIGAFIPGSPTIVPQSMPGAGSLKAAIYLSSVAPKDGSTFGTFGRTIPLEPLLQGAKFDPRKLSWIGSITSDVSLCVTWSSSPVKTLDDAVKNGGKFGGQGAGSDPDVFVSVLKKMLGARMQLVTGYPGNNELALAMERGEIDGYCGLSYSSLVASHPDWLPGHKINILVQAALERGGDLPDVPMLLDKVADPNQKAALRLILTAQMMARPYAAPPGIPADRLAALRTAFDRAVASPEFRAEAEKMGLDVNPVSGTRLEELISQVYATSPDVIALAKQAVGY